MHCWKAASTQGPVRKPSPLPRPPLPAGPCPAARPSRTNTCKFHFMPPCLAILVIVQQVLEGISSRIAWLIWSRTASGSPRSTGSRRRDRAPYRRRKRDLQGGGGAGGEVRVEGAPQRPARGTFDCRGSQANRTERSRLAARSPPESAAGPASFPGTAGKRTTQ